MDTFVSLVNAAVLAGAPLLFGTIGEILTEKSGNLNLGVEGLMFMGAISGLAGVYLVEMAVGSLHSTLLVMLLAVIPETLGLAAYQLVQSSGRMWQSLFLIVGPRDLLYLLLSSIWISSYGLTGAASAYLVAYTLGCVATILVARFDGALIRPASASE